MYLVLDFQNLIVSIANVILYVKRQSNGILISSNKEEMSGCYLEEKDVFYPIGESINTYKCIEVELVPPQIIPGYWYYRDGFFTTAKKMYEYRDKLLDDCDKTFCNAERWAKMEEAEQSIWAQYKQELRDISLQPEFPYNVVFPTAPAEKFGGDHLTAIMADGTEISLLSAEQNAIYADGKRCLSLELCVDANTYQDQKLRELFSEPNKSKSITIEKKEYKGFTELVRSVYESGKITIIISQKADDDNLKLQEQIAAQQEAISILMGGTNNG